MPGIPRARLEDPGSAPNIPSWSTMLERGASPDDYLWRVSDMLGALTDEQRYQLVARALQRVVDTYADEVADDPEGGVSKAQEILSDIRRLTRLEGGMGPALASVFEFKHHTDMRSDRSRFWGLGDVPLGLGRLYIALGGWVEFGRDPGMAGLLISALTSLLEAEGFSPRQLGLVALPYTEDRRWAIRLDELLEQTIDVDATAALETGFPVSWRNIDRLLEYLVPDEAERTSRAGRRILLIAAQTAVQLALEDPRPDVPRIYLDAAAQLVENYLEPIIESGRFPARLRDYGQEVADSMPSPDYEPGPQAGSRLVSRINALPRRRKIVDAADNAVSAAGTAWNGSAEQFVPLWWNAVRNRIPLREGRGRTSGFTRPRRW